MDEKKQKITKPPFEWGNLFCEIINCEIFENYIYDWYHPVKSGDIVLDIGANVGAFTYSILDKNPSRVYCFEPSIACFEILKKNTEFSDKVVLINKAIGKKTETLTKVEGLELSQKFTKDGETIRTFNDQEQTECSVISFSDFIRENGIDQIDFMKFDCEGGEYSIFTQENEDYIKNHVSRASGEFHFFSDREILAFIDFRDRFLKNAKFFKIVSVFETDDIANKIMDDDYLKNLLQQHINNNGYYLLTVYVSWR